VKKMSDRFDVDMEGLVVDVGDGTVMAMLACGDYSEPMSIMSSSFDFPDEPHQCQLHGEMQFAIPLQVYLYEKRLGAYDPSVYYEDGEGALMENNIAPFHMDGEEAPHNYHLHVEMGKGKD
jgi:hypothetical protein